MEVNSLPKLIIRSTAVSVSNSKSEVCEGDDRERRMSEPPTEKELPLLNQFREKVRDLLPKNKLENDAYLLRWLRARDLDLEKAFLMLSNMRVDELMEESYSEEWSSVIAGCSGGMDKHGHPVVGLPAGEWEVRKALDDGRKDELVRYTIQILETLEATLELMWRHSYPQKTSVQCTKFSVIIDLKGFTYGKFAHKKSMETLLEVVKFYEANYPETLARCIIINSPRIFSMLFAMVKPFLSEATVSKISIFDSNEKNWLKAVRETVDDDQLPPKYGGSKDLSKFT